MGYSMEAINDLYIPLGYMKLSRKQNKQLQKCARRPSAVLILVHATLLRGTPCSRAFRHRFGPVQASPIYIPFSPVARLA